MKPQLQNALINIFKKQIEAKKAVKNLKRIKQMEYRFSRKSGLDPKSLFSHAISI